jgi:formylmethanofuran dehydrogenase subunit E
MSNSKSGKPNKRIGHKHSQETKALISERRRARTVQPRNVSQSKKRTSFYHELLREYSKNPEAVKWIEDNKSELGYIENLTSREQLLEVYEKHGILTEYFEMYSKVYEEKCGDILYSDERTPVNDKSLDPWDMVENLDEYNSIFGEYDE